MLIPNWKKRRFTLEEKFDFLMMVVVIINTFFLFFSGYWDNSPFFEWGDCFFTIVFIVEALFKMFHNFKGFHNGVSTYFHSNWNVFDFVILLLALPSLLYPFVGVTIGSNVLLSLRALRVLKAFRVFEYMPNIGKLLKGLGFALKSSFMVTIAYSVFLLVVSIMTSSLFSRYSPQFFSDPLTSLFSTFQLFTLEGWYEIPNSIMESGGVTLGNLAKTYFSVLLFFGGIIGMSLINSVFVDAMAVDNNQEILDKLDELKKEIRELKEEKCLMSGNHESHKIAD